MKIKDKCDVEDCSESVGADAWQNKNKFLVLLAIWCLCLNEVHCDETDMNWWVQWNKIVYWQFEGFKKSILSILRVLLKLKRFVTGSDIPATYAWRKVSIIYK